MNIRKRSYWSNPIIRLCYRFYSLEIAQNNIQKERNLKLATIEVNSIKLSKCFISKNSREGSQKYISVDIHSRAIL
jgi:hypothetical protein